MTRVRRWGGLTGLLAALAALLLAGTAHAATIVVDTGGDPVLFDCSLGHAAGTCSLRGAVAGALANDTITFDAAANSVALSLGQIIIDKSLTITGNGARTTVISGQDATRIFDVTAGTVSINSLTLTHGHAIGGGGALLAEANVSLTDVAVTSSLALPDSNATAVGGGIRVTQGTLTLLRTTVMDNTAGGPPPPNFPTSIGIGGGIGMFPQANATVSVNNSTIADNVATGVGATGGGQGGGIGSYAANVSLTYVTLSRNSATETTGTSEGGNLESVNAVFSLFRTIVAFGVADTGSNCGAFGSAVYADGRYNLETTTPSQCGLSAANGDLVGADPLFVTTSPTDNGGQTDTLALASTSPAVDAIPVDACVVSTDQRLEPRPSGVGCDMGAFELQAEYALPQPLTNASVRGSAFFLFDVRRGGVVQLTLSRRTRGHYKRLRGAVRVRAHAGRNRVRLPHKLAGHRLERGHYRLTAMMVGSVPGPAVHRTFTLR